MGTEYNAFTGTVTTNGASYEGSSGQTTSTPSAEFHAHSGFEVEGDIMTTAKSPSGSAIVSRAVTATDTIEFFGQRMTVAMATQMGFLAKDAGGTYAPTGASFDGGKSEAQTKGALGLASGGTAEEALAGDFRAAPEVEDTMSFIVGNTNTDTQISAIHSFLQNDGTFDSNTIERMASQAGVEPHEMEESLYTAYEGMTTAVMQHLVPFGVYDPDTFTQFMHASPQTHQRMQESVRDLLMNNSTKGFEKLAEDFAESADMVDPESVEEALNDAGIKFTRMRSGGVLLDLTDQGRGQVTFKQAVQMGLIKLSHNR